MSVNLDKVQVRKAVDQAAAGDLANAAKIINVHFIDVSTDELFSACWYSVEHLICALEEMYGAEDKIEPVPMFLHPTPAGCGMNRIVVQLNAGTEGYVW